MNPNIKVRELLPSEIYLLQDILYEAIYQPDENNHTKKRFDNTGSKYLYKRLTIIV